MNQLDGRGKRGALTPSANTHSRRFDLVMVFRTASLSQGVAELFKESCYYPQFCHRQQFNSTLPSDNSCSPVGEGHMAKISFPNIDNLIS